MVCLSDSFLTKLNNVVTAASNSSSKIDQLATFIHTCATDNTAYHNLSQDNNNHTRQEPIPGYGQWFYKQENEELEYLNPPNPIDLDLILMTPDEILDDISQILVKPEFLSAVQNTGANKGRSTSQTTYGPTHNPPVQPTAQQLVNMKIPHPSTNPKTSATTNQAPPRPDCATAAASSGWK